MTAETLPALARLRRALTRLVLLIVVPAVAIVTASHFYFAGGRHVVSENAYVKADIISISADIAGRVIDVAVADNDQVSSGGELFKLDPQPIELQVAEARAEMDVARADIESMRADYREASAAIEAARERVRFMASQYERQSALKAQGLGVTESHDEAFHNLQAAEQSVAVLTQRARRALANLGGSVNLATESHPAFLQAQARYQQAQALLDKTTVLAPDNGIVSNVRLQPGEYVQAGAPVFTLIDTDKVWIEANLKETRLTNIRTGQVATIEVDAYPDLEWPAVVATIAPATGAEFSMLPAQNATGNWVKVVQRIPVTLAIEKPANAPPLRAGMTATVSIDTQRKRALPQWLSAIAHAQSLPVIARKVLHIALAIDSSDQTTAESSQLQLIAAAGQSIMRPVQAQPSTALADLAASLSPPPAPAAQRAEAAGGTDEAGRYDGHWLIRQHPDDYTIQIGSSVDLAFLQRFAKQLPQDRAIITYHYKTNASQMAEYGLASGIFPSRADARAAMVSLPENSARYGPWVRQLSAIQQEMQALDSIVH